MTVKPVSKDHQTFSLTYMCSATCLAISLVWKEGRLGRLKEIPSCYRFFITPNVMAAFLLPAIGVFGGVPGDSIEKTQL